MKSRFQGTFKPFKEGDKVWLESKNLSTPYLSKKISPKREGPFKIKEVLSPLTYRLDLPDRWKIHDVFHASLLTPFTQTEVYGPAFPNPPPEEVEGEEEYEVEEAVDARLHRGKIQYLIKWVGYDEKTWEPASALSLNAKGALMEFYRKHPGAPRAWKVTMDQIRKAFVPRYKFTEPDTTNGWSGRPTLGGG